jgi:hypothetical protein
MDNISRSNSQISDNDEFAGMPPLSEAIYTSDDDEYLDMPTLSEAKLETVEPIALAAPVATPVAAKKIPTEQEMLKQYENINTPIMQFGQSIFNYLINILFNTINSSMNTPYFLSMFGSKRIKAHVLNQSLDKQNKIKEIVKINDVYLAPVYLKGGMAYKAYDMFLTLKNDIDIKTPKTVDYDIVYCIDNLNSTNEKDIIDFITQFIRDHYTILNSNNYIENNFDIIDETNSLQEGSSVQLIHLNKIKLEQYEQFISLINKKVLITMYKHPRYNFNISLRVSVFRNGITERIFDITFTKEEDAYKKINRLNVITVNKVGQELQHHIVPDIAALMQMSLVSLINRGTSPTLYNKCQKDYFRIKYLIDLLDNFKGGNTRMVVGYNIGTIAPKLDYIMSLIPHCKKYVDETDINSNYFSRFPDQYTVREMIREIIYGKFKTDELEQKKKMIDSMYKSNNTSDYLDRNKRKYLKYKQKYFELKKLITHNPNH